MDEDGLEVSRETSRDPSKQVVIKTVPFTSDGSQILKTMLNQTNPKSRVWNTRQPQIPSQALGSPQDFAPQAAIRQEPQREPEELHRLGQGLGPDRPSERRPINVVIRAWGRYVGGRRVGGGWSSSVPQG